MIQPEPEEIRLTYEDYLELPNDGKRYEIIEGELHVAPAPDAKIHQTVLSRLLVRLFNHVEAHDLGSVLPSPVDVVLSDYDVVQPDIVFVARERLGIVRREIAGPPDLAIEIISQASARLDRTVKRKLYAAHGVRYYWLVDPHVRRLEEYELVGNAYRLRSRIEGEAIFKPALFPDLEIPFGRVWVHMETTSAK